MELLLDMCCLWVWSTEQGGQDSEKLGETFQSKINTISHTSHSLPLFHFHEIIQLCGWSSDCFWPSVPGGAGPLPAGCPGVSPALQQQIRGNGVGSPGVPICQINLSSWTKGLSVSALPLP